MSNFRTTEESFEGETEFAEYSPLLPIHFFALAANCLYCAPKAFPKTLGDDTLGDDTLGDDTLDDSYILPDTSSLAHEQSFAEVRLGWNREGIVAEIHSAKPAEESFTPDIQKGDAVELFIDTRDVKTSGYNTRFCHHFFFLPQEADDVVAGEITRFRTDDAHEHCDASLLRVSMKMQRRGFKRGYLMQLFIPAECLHGYEPEQFDRLGFAYRINRYQGEPQHFAASSANFAIHQQPSLWGSLKLIGK